MRKPYKTVDDFCTSVEELITALKANGSVAEASRLDTLLHCAWTTGSELMGELMLALADMTGNLPTEIRKRRNDCHYFAKHHRRILGLD